LLLLSACSQSDLKSFFSVSSQPEQLKVKVLAKIPHDPTAFTEGLVLANGKMYESAGLDGQSTLREVDPATGKVLRKISLDKQYFAEGISVVGDKIIQMTWQQHVAFVYDLATFKQIGTDTYMGEGWGQCYDGTHIYSSDGSSTITMRDPDTFAAISQIKVTESGKPIDQLNELECVGNKLYENVWHTDNILEIDKTNGQVTAVIDASGLLTPPEAQAAGTEGVLNGIAYDPQKQDFIITGKLWPWMFEVQFVPA
jgi:glutaminyl-peptide cyclotransferase